MEIKLIKRPWQKQGQRRYNKDPRYNTQSWRDAREIHKSKSTTVSPEEFKKIVDINPSLRYTNGTISNMFCIPCYKEGKLKPMHTVDHSKRVKDGADFYDSSNYESQCMHHHAVKSAKEAQL